MAPMTKNLLRPAQSAAARAFDSVKVFSATMFPQRESLGELVTEWINANPQHSISDIVVTQSSDASFHCIAISVFYVTCDRH